MRERIEALETRVAELEQTIRDLKALAKGDPGRDGKDGRDGRDGKSLQPRQIVAMLRDIVPTHSASSVIVQPATPQIVVQASEVSLEATLQAPVVENHVHVDGVREMVVATKELNHTMRMPMRPVTDKAGKMIGSERVEKL